MRLGRTPEMRSGRERACLVQTQERPRFLLLGRALLTAAYLHHSYHQCETQCQSRMPRGTEQGQKARAGRSALLNGCPDLPGRCATALQHMISTRAHRIGHRSRMHVSRTTPEACLPSQHLPSYRTKASENPQPTPSAHRSGLQSSILTASPGDLTFMPKKADGCAHAGN